MLKNPAMWPLVEALIIGIFVLACVLIMHRANRDRKNISMVEIPEFLVHGPLHDTMNAISNIKSTVDGIDRGQKYTHQLLEAILRNQGMRPDPPAETPVPSRRKPHN
jgi:hypothetical protein